MTDSERITAAKSEYTKQLKQIGNVSFSIWMLNRAEAAETELEESGAAYVAKCYTVTELQRINAELLAERDELTRKLEQAQREIDAFEKFNGALSQILNEGDGVYRP